MQELPERFEGITAPTYEALMPCYMLMTSPETGQSGPTLVNPGEIFSSDAIPNHQWMPLNRSAGERYERWLAALPQSGTGLTQGEITEAAFAMRPREGEPEIPHDQWWPAVLKYAAAMKDKRQGNYIPAVRPATVNRPGAPQQVMPFAPSATGMPMEPGRAPPQGSGTPVPPANAARRAMGKRPAMEGAPTSDSPTRAAG